MSSSIDILQSFLNAGFLDFLGNYINIGGSAGANSACPGPLGDPDMPATAFTALGAAFATQGYYVQHDMLDYLTFTDMGLWAPLLYVIAAAGGLCSLALGMPPKMYMWFFMGPAIYSWLLGTRVESYGVRWALPCQTRAEQETLQPEVWKLAEPGLVNSNLARRYNGRLKFTKNSMPSEPAYVSYLFLWFDDLVSGTVFALTEWTGVNSLRANSSAGANTNVTQNTDTGSSASGGSSSGGTAAVDSKYWYLLSDSKFLLMDEIVSAKLHSTDLRDAFATFFQSECGDTLRKTLSTEAMVAAGSSGGGALPQTVFNDTLTPISQNPGGYGPPNPIPQSGNSVSGRANIRQILVSESIPFPRSLKNLLKSREPGSFYQSVEWGDAAAKTKWMIGDSITCDSYLGMLIHGFRWETGHIAYQLLNSAAPKMASIPDGAINESHVVSALLYGWDIRKNRTLTSGASGTAVAGGEALSLYEQQSFVKDLIFLHLFRNELAWVPQAIDRRYSNAENVQNYTKAHQRSIGAKNKFGEVYTWAKLIPYVQGVLLYVLAMAYPFACILIVIPGWHKTIFTWMSFWAWVKLWDFGFALVRSMEKSIWAMSGNNLNVARISDRVTELQQVGGINYSCPTSGVTCAIPKIQVLGVPLAGGASGPLPFGGTVLMDKPDSVDQALSLIDHAFILSQNLDFDLSNGYYIYIMAALYFAVPTVTGQLVLGARAGAAGMVGQMIGGISQEAGRQAGAGAMGDLTARGKANFASIGQAAAAKSLRASHPELGADGGLGAKALGYGISAMEASRSAGYASQAARGQAKMNTGLNNGFNQSVVAADAAWAVGRGAYQQYKSGPGDRENARRKNGFENGVLGAAAGRGGGLASAELDRRGIDGTSGAAVPLLSGSRGSAAGTGGGSDNEVGATNKAVTLPGGSGATDNVASTKPGILGDSGPAASGSVGSSGSRARIGGGGGAGFGPDGMGFQDIKDGALKGYLDSGSIQTRHNLGADFYPQYMAGEGRIQQLGNQEFSANQLQSQYGHAGKMMGAYAENEAAMAAWEAKNAMNAQLGGISVAYGMYPATFDPGQKPQGMEYLAMSGDLGKSAFDTAWYAMGAMNNGKLDENGGFQAVSNQWRSVLDDNYGYNNVVGSYDPHDRATILPYHIASELGAVGKSLESAARGILPAEAEKALFGNAGSATFQGFTGISQIFGIGNTDPARVKKSPVVPPDFRGK